MNTGDIHSIMMTSQHVVAGLFCAIVGACVGSFLNVCAYRIPRGMSVVRPRSHCPHCGTGILARDNVPVLGWLTLRGQCRECRCAISPRYAVVELAMGLLFAVPYLCAATLAGGDPWERIGMRQIAGIFLASWMATALGAFAILVDRDARWSFRALQALVRRRAEGQGGGLPSRGPGSSRAPGSAR